MPMNKLSILLADDHAIVREGLKHLIEAQSDMEVSAEASDGREAVEKVLRLRPQVVVLDVSMGEFGGAQATRELRASCPASKVLALTVHEDNTYLHELLEAGVSGYVLKRAAPEELIAAIRAIAGGGTYLDHRVAGKLVQNIVQTETSASCGSQLSDREADVLRLIARGYTNKEAGIELGISVKTVETYRSRSMEKLGLRSRIDIVRVATERGWLQTSFRKPAAS
jgi:DNA-binding NarL/FixJ family response regulator